MRDAARSGWKASNASDFCAGQQISRDVDVRVVQMIRSFHQAAAPGMRTIETYGPVVDEYAQNAIAPSIGCDCDVG